MTKRSFTRRQIFKWWFKFKVWAPVRDFFLRIIYCHHNARVIIDFEQRMSAVIYEATNGIMSKSYYTEEAMLSQIRDAFQDEFDKGYNEAKSDYDIKDEE